MASKAEGGIMPDSATHRKLTKFTLSAAPALFAGQDTAELIHHACLLPDLVQNGEPDAMRVCFELDGIPFHYLPDVPLENLYRHHYRDAAGTVKRCRSFNNHHYDFAIKGLTRSLSRILELLRTGRNDEAMKTTGMLLHVLQDNSFGVHTLEGVGGTDVFFFDRLELWRESPFQRLCRLSCSDTSPQLSRQPEALGGSVDEASLRIYRRWCNAIRLGRRKCVEVLLNSKADLQPMTAASVLLGADVLQTLNALYQNNEKSGQKIPLTEFEPYESPVRKLAETANGNSIFSISLEEHLFYQFPEHLFEFFSTGVQATGDAPVHYELINNNVTEQYGILLPGKSEQWRIRFPKHRFGMKFSVERGSAQIILTDPKLQCLGKTPHSLVH